MLKISRHKRPKKKKEKRISSSDDDDVPFWGAVIGGALSLVSGQMSASGQRRRARRSRDEAIKWAKYQSPEELAWLEKTKRRSQYGAEDFQQKKRQAIQPIYTMGKQTRQQATGQAIRQGLENSVIAEGIRSRMDAKTQTQMSKVAQQIALMNEQYKLQQEQAVDKYHLARADRIRSISGDASSKYHQSYATGSEVFGSTLGTFGGQMFNYGMKGIYTQWLKDSGLSGGNNNASPHGY